MIKIILCIDVAFSPMPWCRIPKKVDFAAFRQLITQQVVRKRREPSSSQPLSFAPSTPHQHPHTDTFTSHFLSTLSIAPPFKGPSWLSLLLCIVEFSFNQNSAVLGRPASFMSSIEQAPVVPQADSSCLPIRSPSLVLLKEQPNVARTISLPKTCRWLVSGSTSPREIPKLSTL